MLSGAQDSHLGMLLLTPRYSYQNGPHDLTTMLLPEPVAFLPDHFEFQSAPRFRYLVLAPYILRIRPLGWSAITRCLEDGCF